MKSFINSLLIYESMILPKNRHPVVVVSSPTRQASGSCTLHCFPDSDYFIIGIFIYFVNIRTFRRLIDYYIFIKYFNVLKERPNEMKVDTRHILVRPTPRPTSHPTWNRALCMDSANPLSAKQVKRNCYIALNILLSFECHP